MGLPGAKLSSVRAERMAEMICFQPFGVGHRFGIDLAGLRPGCGHDGVGLDAGRHAHFLPDLLGDEGHERMQQPEGLLEHGRQGVAGGACGDFVGILCQRRLGQFQVPVAELVPDEFVERLGGQVEAVVGQ
jgi:hypothetical protein